MQMTDYIPSTNDIRALLGVSVKELKDETILLPVYAVQLETQLESLYTGIPDVFEALKAKKQLNETDPDNNPPLTKLERKIYGLTQVYSCYAAAMLLAPSLPIFGMRKIGDGKAEQERVQTAFDEIKGELLNAMTALGDELLEKLEEYGEEIPTTTPVFYQTAVAELGTDPVTGE
jgi:hypothetical protein